MSDKKDFVQIHLHTSFSQLDGCCSPSKLIKKAKELGHRAIAITDHGNPSGLFEHAKECKKQGIKPILGLEFYINNDLRSRVSHKERETIEDRDYHQSVYIKNKEGYLNFNYLTYMSFTEGYYYKPRIDFDLLFERKKGLMITSSCMASKIGNYVRLNQHKDAEDLFRKYVKEFGEDFYAEIQFNEVKSQKEINDFIIHQARKYGTKLLIGGDVHYLNPGDGALQDALIKSKRENENSDWTIEARSLYYHDVSDYYKFNKELGWNYQDKLLEECFENSIHFSGKANFEFETGKYHLPKFDTGKLTSKEYLEKVTWEGITKNIETERKYFPSKYTDEEIGEIEKRVEYELKIIDDMGVSDYMLLIYDIIKWCKEKGIYVGPGRGSAAGAAVGWGTGITSLNPIEHGLLFERFINPERKQFPDIDTDFMQGGRDLILQYLIDKYGQDSVCNVATFGTFGPKSALQSMSRGLKKETGQDTVLMKKITKLPEIENADRIAIPDLVEYFKKVRIASLDREVIDWIDNNQDTIDFAQKIQGQMTQLGVHAGGIIITPGPIYDFIPVTRGSGNLISAFPEADGSGKTLSELGILKLDILGVSTLNILKYCVDNIKRDKGIDLQEKIYHLDLTDKNIFNYFMNKSPYGIFQMERAKMFTPKINVDSFNDIVAINALNRPGPLEKYLNKYGYWKDIDQGKIQITDEELQAINKERYPFPFMEKVLKQTYGCLLFQEQFMLLVKEAAGFDMGEADSFRRGIAWLPDNPKYYTVAKYFEKLEEGMKLKGYSKEDVDAFVKYCRDFLGYSFNRSHSACYSYITWQTLYFKSYYPSYFYAAMINSENDIEKINEIISDAKENGIEILPHSILKSQYEIKVESDTSIRLGYGMIKGMGSAVEEEINELQLHECKTLNEVLQKPFKKINTTQFDNLIQIGAFDEFNIDRNDIKLLKELYSDPTIEKWFTRQKQTLRLETIPKVLKENFNEIDCLKIAMRVRGEKEPWKILISELIGKIKTKELNSKKYLKETITKQKELLGFSLLSDSKLLEFASSLRVKGALPLSDFKEENREYYFLVEKVIKSLTKSKKKYVQLTLSDGKKAAIKTKCWKDIDLIEGEVYCGKFSKDDYGFILKDRGFYKIG